MWDYKVMQEQWSQRSRDVQEQLADSAATGRHTSAAAAEKFSLGRYEQAFGSMTKAVEAQISARQFDTSQSLSKALDNKEYAAALAESRMGSKEQGELLEKSGLERSAHRRIDARALSAPDVRQTLQASQADNTQSSKLVSTVVARQGILGQGIAQNSALSTPVEFAPSSAVSKEAFTILEGQRSVKKGENSSAVGGGTQSAITRETKPMPTYFSTSTDLRRDDSRAWNRPSYEMVDEAIASGATNRQGAIIERSSYSNTAIEQSLMPRLAELVQRLSAMGYSWARVVVPVDAQTKVIVRFNTQSGRVKMNFSTPSEGLCEIIRNCWSALTNLVGQNGISLDQPTFETENHE